MTPRVELESCNELSSKVDRLAARLGCTGDELAEFAVVTYLQFETNEGEVP